LTRRKLKRRKKMKEVSLCLSVFLLSISFRNFKKIMKSWENEAPIQANVSKHSCLKWIKKKLGGRWPGRKEAEKTEEEHTEKSEWSTTTLSKSTSSRAQLTNYTTEKGLICRIIIHIHFYPLG
jgi:hypothetical protein